MQYVRQSMHNNLKMTTNYQILMRVLIIVDAQLTWSEYDLMRGHEIEKSNQYSVSQSQAPSCPSIKALWDARFSRPICTLA